MKRYNNLIKQIYPPYVYKTYVEIQNLMMVEHVLQFLASTIYYAAMHQMYLLPI